ncbi:MAG: hypothetical protein K1X78_05995 [Verrucomicrobiaceae bacterium]|nr:hypothetical protein [Verrucomicrobiaceae bacterium]
MNFSATRLLSLSRLAGAALSVVAWFAFTAPDAVAAVTYELLASFQKPGTQVITPLTLHSDGNFYGVASSNGASGVGTVFKLTPAGALTTLFAFDDTNGAGPTAKLIEGSDNALYGTTSSGGSGGFGVVFKITTGGVFTKLVDFSGTAGAARGSVPHGLMLHADGNFYGVTQGGGTNGFGTVFKMTPAGVITTLLDFTGTTGTRPGAEPLGPLVASGSLLYGVTRIGGTAGLGVIFEVSTAGAWRSLGEFSGTTGTRAGSNPAGALFLNVDGALYGTAEFGGTNSFGVAFKITTAVSPVYTVLRHFADPTGSQPTGAFVRGADGLLYGATAFGGTSGLGTLYKITTTGTHTVLANFTGETGATPGSSMRGGLVVGADGAFYGVSTSGAAGNLGSFFKVTSAGVFTALSSLSLTQGWMPSGAPVASGSGSLLFPVAAGGANGGGNVMSVTTTGVVSVAAALGGTLGTFPDGGLRAAGSTFYGVTAKGGASARGTTFRYVTGTGASLVVAHNTSSGSLAEGALVLGADGQYYGVGREGGASSRGAIFKVTTAGVRTRIVSLTGTTGAAPGGKPRGPLVLAADGNFYGLTEDGGSANTGVIFRLTAAGVYSALYHFAVTGPRSPQGGFVIGNDGLLYATTGAGGTTDDGAMIRFNPATNAVDVIGEFTGVSGAVPGNFPGGELLVGSDGAIYGLTLLGGASGEGTVFRYTSSGGLQTLVQFTGVNGAAPGSAADTDGAGLILSGGLAFGADGLLYGVASGSGPGGGGVVFRLTITSPMSDWKLANLGDANAPDLGDADHDGIANVLEYALVTSPTTPDSSSQPAATVVTFPDDTRLSMIVPRDPARADITIIVEASSTLLPASWTTLATSTNGGVFTGPGYYSGDSATAGVKLVTIRDVVSAGPTPRFMRVRVTH